MFSYGIRSIDIDWEHPLARGLVAVSINGTTIVKGKDPTLSPTNVYSCGEVSVHNVSLPSDILNSTTQTVVAFLEIPTEPSGWETSILIGYWYSDSDSFHFGLLRNGLTSNQMLIAAKANQTELNSGTTSFNVTYPFKNHIRIETSAWSTSSIYLNGSSIATSTVNNLSYIADNRKILYTRNAKYAFVFNRLLSVEEDNFIKNDPYIFLKKHKTTVPVSWNPDPGVQNASIAFGPYPLVARPGVSHLYDPSPTDYADVGTKLNYSNPLTFGLVAASINQGTPQDITVYTNTGGFTTDRDGVLIQGGQYFTSTTNRISNVPFTVVTLMRSGSAGSDVALFSSYLDSSNSISLMLNTSSLPYVSTIGSGTSGTATSTIPVPSNQFIVVGGVFSAINNRTVWVNGIKTGTNTTSLSAGNSAHNRWGARGAGAYFAGAFKIRLVWNRALSDAEMKSIGENPWQVFEKKRYAAPIVLGPRSLITQASSPYKIKKRVSADVQEIPNNIISGFSDNLEINYEHPLANNLLNWVIPPRRGYSKIVGGIGYSSSLSYYSSNNIYATGPYTVVTKLYYDDRTTSTQFSRVVSVAHFTTWPTDIDEIGINTDTGSNIYVLKRQNTGSLPAAIAGPSTGSVVDTSIVVPSTSGGNGSSWAYMNGTFYSIDTPFGSTPTFATGKTRTIGAGSSTAKVYAAYLFVFDKQLSLAEINSVHRDPWGLLKATPYNTSKFAYIKSADSGILVPPVLSNPSVSDITATTALPSVKVEF